MSTPEERYAVVTKFAELVDAGKPIDIDTAAAMVGFVQELDTFHEPEQRRIRKAAMGLEIARIARQKFG